MNSLDRMFLEVEDGPTHMHIGSCWVFVGPAGGSVTCQQVSIQRAPRSE